MAERSYPDMFSVEQKYAPWLDNEELEMVREVKGYVDDEMLPMANEYEGGWHRDRERALDAFYGAYADLADIGVQEALVPRSYGGPAVSIHALQAMREEIARADPGITTALGKVHWMTYMLQMVSEGPLHEELLPAVVDGSPKSVAVLITEEQGGANIEDLTQEGRPIRVTAEKDGDEWVLNGHKKWGGPGGPPEHFEREDHDGHLGYFVVTNVDPSKGSDGIAIFYVPPGADGLSFGEPYEKMGMAWTDRNVEYWFDDVRIPEEYRLDDPESPTQAASILHGVVMGGGKLGSAATLVGTAQRALEVAIDHAGDRTIKGQPMRERPMFANMFGELARDVEAARSYGFTVTGMIEDPMSHGTIWSPSVVGRAGAARSFAADVNTRAFDRAFQLMGAQGYAYDAGLDKLKRDSKIVQLWLGGPQRDRLDMAYAHFDHEWLSPDDFQWHYEDG
ncbi:MAG: acyl-CoA dehydrogenase family protein [Halobacteriales archaeon]